METSPKCLAVLRHTLTGNVCTVAYRNYYAAGEGHYAQPEIKQLLEAGLMRQGEACSDGHYYHATAAGAAALGLKLPPGQ